MTRTAECECGLFKIQTETEPTVVGVCSCKNCQRRSGSVFGTVAYFPKDSVTVLSGQYKTFQRNGDTGGKLDQHFCPECGTTVLLDAEFLTDCRGVPVGCFADPSFPPPQLVIYDRSRHLG